MPGLQGRQFSLLDTELGDLCPVLLDPAQPGGWGSAHVGSFRTHRTRPPQPAHQTGRHAGRERASVGEPAGSSSGTRRSSRPRPAAKRWRCMGTSRTSTDASRSSSPAPTARQGALHGDRRRLAVAEGGRGPVPLPVLGAGGAVDGVPAEHGQGRNDAALLHARPAATETDDDAQRPCDGIERRAALERERRRPHHRAVG